MRNAAEVVCEVSVDHVAITAEQQPSHLSDCLSGITARTVSTLLRWKISFSR
jgi:hypothetical protein